MDNRTRFRRAMEVMTPFAESSPPVETNGTNIRNIRVQYSPTKVRTMVKPCNSMDCRMIADSFL